MSTKTHGNHHPHSTSHNEHAVVAENSTEHGRQMNDVDHISLIKTRAYGLWEEAGKPDGDSARERFWSEAEKKVAKGQ